MRLPAFCKIKPVTRRLPLLLLILSLLCSGAAAEERTVIIPVSFNDLALSTSRDSICSLAESAASFLEAQMRGRRDVSLVVADPVTLSRPYAYYGANTTDRRDAFVQEAVVEACELLDPYFDFSGTEFVVLLTAGLSEAYGGGEDFFWPVQSSLSEFNLSLSLDGCRLDAFAVCPEFGADSLLTGIGDLCHEYGHFLGLKDLYDTDSSGSGGEAHTGLDTLSLMARGNRNCGGYNPAPLCAVDYDQLPWFQGTALEKGLCSLAPIEEDASFGILPSTDPGKYCLLENRSGCLLVTSVDKSGSFAGFSDRMKKNLTASQRWEYNEVNCNPDHLCARLSWQGSEGCFVGDSLSLSSIRSEADGSISFFVFEPVVLSSVTAWQDGISVSWTSELDASGIVSTGLEWWTDDGKVSEAEATRLEGGSYHYTIDTLKASTLYKIFVHITSADGQTYSRIFSVSTLDKRAGARPFILLDSSERNSDGTFISGARIPLRLRNSPDGARVEWRFNGRAVVPEADGLWTIPGDGTLCARIAKEDGSEEVIVKTINIK